jgi:invasion protein IalB
VKLNILPALILLFTTAFGTLGLAQSTDGIKNQLEVGETYKKAEYGDWILRCIRTDSKKDPCELFQLLRDNSGSPVVEFIMLNFEPDSNVVAGANIMTPLETLLTSQLIVTVDGGISQSYPFAFCLKMGCVARIGLTQTDLKNYKNKKKAIITIVPANAPNNPQNLTLSLSGFTAGYDALTSK